MLSYIIVIEQEGNKDRFTKTCTYEKHVLTYLSETDNKIIRILGIDSSGIARNMHVEVKQNKPVLLVSPLEGGSYGR